MMNSFHIELLLQHKFKENYLLNFAIRISMLIILPVKQKTYTNEDHGQIDL